MGYLDGDSITVDAVLTKKGRELLARGGALDITHFSATDTGIDYTLWNADHPSGSAFYGEAIENLPGLEASVHAEYTLRNRLITLGQDTIALPALELNGLTGTNTMTFDDSHATAGINVGITIKGYAGSGGTLQMLVHNNNVVKTNARKVKGLTGVTRTFIPETNIVDAQLYEIPITGGDTFVRITPDLTSLKTGRKTMITWIHKETAAYIEADFTNNVTKQERQVLKSARTGN